MPWFGRVLNIIIAALLAVMALLWAVSTARADDYPRRAEQYRRDLVRYARYVWGLGAPVAMLAGQVEQESAWKPEAESPYAQGLTQFTPATATWIAGVFPKDLANPNPFDPRWALRAQSRYMHRLARSYKSAASECEQLAMALSAYNGGAGHTNKQRRWAKEAGADPARWFGHAETFCRRAAWACKENTRYPRVILLERQRKYRKWGRLVDCGGVQ